MALPGILPLVPSLIQAGIGAGQFIGGLFTKAKRPQATIPSELLQSLGEVQAFAQGRAPGAAEAERGITQGVASVTAAARRNIGNVQSIAAIVSAAQANANRARLSLAQFEAQSRAQRLAALSNVRAAVAGQQNRVFQLNELNPFVDRARTRAALISSGIKNVFGATVGATQTLRDARLIEALQQGFSASSPQGGLGFGAQQGLSGLNAQQLLSLQQVLELFRSNPAIGAPN